LSSTSPSSPESTSDAAVRALELDNARLSVDNAGLRHANDDLARLSAELARSNADLERFAYVASHDLSEPLRAISAFSQRLAERYEGQLDADADEYIGYILEGTERMRTLIQALLAYSRLGRAELRLERVATATMVRHVLDSFGEEQAAVVDVGTLPTVVADRPQLGQVFQNLIGNALKFCGEAEPRVTVTAEREDGAWRFDVADNGIGIEARYAEKIFVVFERLHSRQQYPGTGIGLSICQRAVERHGGRIWLRPAPGGGTVFSFTIPDAEPS
jgi:light-regulated signal transduction histidine kinase (bacteriophytochrome)